MQVHTVYKHVHCTYKIESYDAELSGSTETVAVLFQPKPHEMNSGYIWVVEVPPSS